MKPRIYIKTNFFNFLTSSENSSIYFTNKEYMWMIKQLKKLMKEKRKGK